MARDSNTAQVAANKRSGPVPERVQCALTTWGMLFQDCDPHAYLQALHKLIDQRAQRTEAFFNADINFNGRLASSLAHWQDWLLQGHIENDPRDRETFWLAMLLCATKGDVRKVSELIEVACYFISRTASGQWAGLDETERARWMALSALRDTSPALITFFYPDKDPEVLRLSLWMFHIHMIRFGHAIFDGRIVHYSGSSSAQKMNH